MKLQAHIEYTPSQIANNNWIRNNAGKGDYRLVLRLIRTGKLQARNVCLTGGKQFRVRGESILNYLKGQKS